MAKKNFDTLGIMLDMSRNAVMSMESLETMLPLMKKMGFNMVMLYTEDTFEVDGEPYFGYMRGRYSKEELKKIDALCQSLGMELIPCVQTLAHLGTALRWGKIPRDCGDIVLCDEERTYEFIENMFKTVSECFSSRKIHIGMDEANMLGRGSHLDKFGYESVHSIIKRHLDRVVPMAKKYWDDVLIWSDMYFYSWNNGQYRIPRRQVPQEVIDSVHPDVTQVFWDYRQFTVDGYSAMIENHYQMTDKIWYAGGVWCWFGFAPYNQFSLKSMLPAIEACKQNKVRDIFLTMWGDNGHECSRYGILPSLFHLACVAKGIEDEDVIKSKFKRLTGVEYDDFMALDLPNEVVQWNDTPGWDGIPKNPCKYMLYSDVFSGYLDYTVEPGGNERYQEYASRLHGIAKKTRRYGYIFDTMARLCDILGIKYELGVKTRNAYQQGDKEELKRLANQEYAAVIRHIKGFVPALRKQWMLENKPYGFEVQEARLGGLMLRLESCRQRLLDYAGGKISKIDELEDEVLCNGVAGKSVHVNDYSSTVTVNRL